MHEAKPKHQTRAENRARPKRSLRSPAAHKTPRDKRSPSMHEGVAVWCDCCSCEAEPYWVEAAEPMGMAPGNDDAECDR
jgi:hypothetical protein